MGRLYTRIYNHLNTNWETGVIAKPSFFDMTLYDFRPANSLGILTNQEAGFSYPSANRIDYGRPWDFQIHLHGTSDANLELMIEQTIEKINDYEDGNKTWYIMGFPEFDSRLGIKSATITCQEKAIISGGANVSW